MIEQVVSGGQTGVDQAGLRAASEAGIAVGGFCPKGGLDENKACILDQYPSLKEAKTSDPDERTKLNIDHSDGTLILVPSLPLADTIRDGTRLTISYAEQQQKPNLTISLAEKEHTIERIQDWLTQHDIKILNVAGPRESNAPGIYQSACNLFQELFVVLRPKLTI